MNTKLRPATPAASVPALTARLRARDHRVTGPRQAILDSLGRQQRPLSIKEILADLRGERCDLATIYRAIHLLEKMKMVKRCELGDGIARFELLGEDDDGHRHYLVCTACRAVVVLHDCCLDDMERRVAQKNGFKTVTHRLEFFGLCPACQ